MGKIEDFFSGFATWFAAIAGRPYTFVLALAGILVWAVLGPAFNFSEEWQLVVNTGTTIVTFLMVFLIQCSQNRDGAALQAKLDELIRVSDAQNRFIGIDHLSQREVDRLRQICEARARGEEVGPIFHGEPQHGEAEPVEDRARRTPSVTAKAPEAA